MVLHEVLPDFGLDNLLNRGGITVLMVSYWSRGLVPLVLARERNLKGSICFKLPMSIGKCFLKIMAKVDTLPLLALSNKRQNVT